MVITSKFNSTRNTAIVLARCGGVAEGEGGGNRSGASARTLGLGGFWRLPMASADCSASGRPNGPS